MGKLSAADIYKLIVSLVACQAAGIIGSIFTVRSIPTWYAALQKPSFNPPNYIFAPVWIGLYLLMGFALFIVWRKGLEDAAVRTAVILFAVQLVLNALWSFLFFGLQSPSAGFAEIVILWAAILATVVLFFRVSTPAGILLVPYIVWVTFAAVLNFSLWRLNS